MKVLKENIRIFILVFLSICLCLTFTARLMEYQLTNGEKYLALANQGIVYPQTMQAARGEIVDRYGSPFSYNTIGYNLVLDRALMPEGIDNSHILDAVKVIEELGETWIGELPITTTTPYVFTDDDTAVAKLRSFVDIAEYASAEDAVHWLKKRYGLGEAKKAEYESQGLDYPFTEEEERKLISIRYQMEQSGFSMSQTYTLAENISLESTIYVQQKSSDLVGIDISEVPLRDYQDSTLAPHIIGRVGAIFAEELETYKAMGYQADDIVGKDGIEKLYEEQLQGQDGQRQVSLNNQYEVIDIEVTEPPIPGDTIVLTIDKTLQSVALEAMEAQIKYLNETAPESEGKEADSGAVVAIDVKTGEVLVLASYPGYDLATMSSDYSSLLEDSTNPLFNRALQGQYTPGSIFKPIVSLAALNEGIITPESTVNCQRVYSFSPTYSPTCLGYHGNVNVVDALRQSCNVFFYDMGYQLGISRINAYARMIGLGVSTGIELDEKIGTLTDPNTINPGDALQAGIGQGGNAFTPLQLAQYTATIARKGEIIAPTILHSITSYNFDEISYTHTPEVVGQMDIPEEHFDTVIEGMIAASTYAGTSGSSFGNYPITVASKTGTPQTHALPNSTYIAFAPAEDPEIAIAVIIEKGWHGYTGAPVAKAVFDAHFFPQNTEKEILPSDTLLS